MQNNKVAIFFIVVICILSASVYSYDVTDLNGFWMDHDTYKYAIKHNDDCARKVWRRGSEYVSLDERGRGFWCVDGIYEFYKGVKKLDENTFEFDCFDIRPGFHKKSIAGDYFNVEFPSDDQLLYTNSIRRIFLDDDTIIVKTPSFFPPMKPLDELEPEDIFLRELSSIWHRVASPKLKGLPSVVNDNRVQLRTKPNLESDTWGFLNKGNRVTIIGKSAEKQKIGDMEAFWYKIQSEDCPDGWVYGKYLDIEEGNEGEADKGGYSEQYR